MGDMAKGFMLMGTKGKMWLNTDNRYSYHYGIPSNGGL